MLETYQIGHIWRQVQRIDEEIEVENTTFVELRDIRVGICDDWETRSDAARFLCRGPTVATTV
jgi:hypothetical protein